jgi:hypothetical protein
MKNLLTVFCFTFISVLAYSQPPKYTDLQILYADGNYEKLAKVASGYIGKDKTKYHVLPYIWIAKGLYKIDLLNSTDEKFKKAYKDAIGFLTKGMKYDLKYNEGATIAEEQEFIDEFQLSLQMRIDNELSQGLYKKAFAWSIKYKKITQNPIGAYYLMGACKFQDQDKPTARTYWKEANIMLESVTGIEGWSEADKKMLKAGVLHSAAAMIKGRQNDSARALINKVAQWFEEDPEWQEQYDEIVH